MKELEPLEVDYTKVKANFAGCEITRRWLRNGVLHVAKFHSHLAHLLNSPEASRYLRPTFFRFFALDI